ncbi:MAG: Fe-S cluster assembly protein SufD [Pseudorhodoplanes sp.]|jgi:Fe-S cluster assembly protein SufD|nr:Fe-S cluster assembly protein SufD [Pseudorhodoplanes sp.]
MNAEIRQIKTAAEQGLADAFSRVRASLPGAGAVAALREKAFSDFEARGLPHRRVEEWKYTDLRALMRDAKPLAAPPDAQAKERAKQVDTLVGDIDRRRIVFVDGVFAPDLSDFSDLESGLSIRPMAEALAQGDPLVTAHLGKVAANNDVAVALNTAFMGDGAVIRIAEGIVVEHPIHLVFITAGEKPAAAFMRSLVVVERGARAMLMESYVGPAAPDYQINSALELVIADNAHVDLIKLIGEGANALHISSLMASVGAHARFNDFTFTTGGLTVRNQLFVQFNGEEAIARVHGANLLKGRQHADTTLVATHAVGHCQSREIFKSVLDDESRGVFQGKIIVQPHAQKTDAKMLANALLLSEAAEADAKPELEIFADDVVCGHGATAGALDEDLLFYLRARGIPPKEAEALLIQAFIGDAVEGIEHAGLREVLMESVVAWLAARG